MSAHPTSDSDDRSRPARSRTAIAIGVAMQIVVAVPFTAGFGLLAPLWGVVAAWALWLVAVAGLVVAARRRPLLAPVVPLANAGLLFALVTFGESVLGWTA
ncbi:MAG TPA: hypothetical protein VJ978_01025 [Nitriliruptoraceae bacterium]|nr:hypothetical protein [Nitriliruptoraceae bacterium]